MNRVLENVCTEKAWIPRFRILELRNPVTQNNVTLPVTNSTNFMEILFRVTYSTSWNITVSPRVTNLKLKNKKFHFELLTRSRKIKSFFSSYWLEVEKSKASLRVTNSKLKNEKFHFELLTRSRKIEKLTSRY